MRTSDKEWKDGLIERIFGDWERARDRLNEAIGKYYHEREKMFECWAREKQRREGRMRCREILLELIPCFGHYRALRKHHEKRPNFYREIDLFDETFGQLAFTFYHASTTAALLVGAAYGLYKGAESLLA